MPVDTAPHWRPMRAAEVAAAAALGNRVHRDYPESDRVFQRRFELYPAGCRILHGAAIHGYAVFHPWEFGSPPRLNEYLEALPGAPACMHLHDIVVAAALRGRGHAGRLIALLTATARESGCARLSLVAVGGKEQMWQRFGFRRVALAGARDACLSYATSAAYMVRDLA
jgi:GNAT superfamily N-acetyltransferase